MKKLPLSSTQDERKPPEEPEADLRDHQSPEGAIRTRVLAALGRPPALYRVAVMPLWGSYYRVNVIVWADAASALVAHSYFVKAGDGGTILTATPPLARVYP